MSGIYKKGKPIATLDELLEQDIVIFNNKPLNKGFFQNWQLQFAAKHMHMLFTAERKEN